VTNTYVYLDGAHRGYDLGVNAGGLGMTKNVLVIGAAGDVGQGIVAASVARGWSIAAAGRTAAKLEVVAARHSGVVALAGDVSSPKAASALMASAKTALGRLNAVIVSVNAPANFRPLFDNDEDSLVALFRSNIVSHFNAAKAALDTLPADGVLLGMGGGMADWVPPNGTHQSIVQAGLRNFYRGLAKEYRGRTVRQMQIVSMVNGESKRDVAQESWLTDRECGEHACAIIENPTAFKGPVVVLKDRAEVGQPPV
jgi:NAD(P)-dependent dehydrogenase (short-subunit alcohol dehydrogenase family)